VSFGRIGEGVVRRNLPLPLLIKEGRRGNYSLLRRGEEAIIPY
jgi:hypothetical protein